MVDDDEKCGWYMFFFNDTATTAIYTYGHTLSLHYALPICRRRRGRRNICPSTRHRSTPCPARRIAGGSPCNPAPDIPARSEEHTSELQSLMRISYAVFCLTKTKKTNCTHTFS